MAVSQNPDLVTTCDTAGVSREGGVTSSSSNLVTPELILEVVSQGPIFTLRSKISYKIRSALI